MKEIENYETLFWKVFKNRYLFKMIMNHTHYFRNIIKSYDSIISVEEMLNENKIEMIKDKVKRNQYLVFKGGYFRSLFSKIQDDIEFYQCLFKYYKISIPDFNDNQFFFAMELSHCNCFGGLQVYIEQFNFKPDQRLLNKSIESGSIDVAQLLIKLLPITTTIDTNQILNLLVSSNFNFKLSISSTNNVLERIFKRYRTIIELFSTNPPPPTTTTTTTTTTKLKSLNHLLKLKDINEKIKNQFKSVLIDPLCPIINGFNLNDLINACHCIIVILLSNEPKNFAVDVEKIINNKNQLFSKQQLDSSIVSPINHDSNKIVKDNIRLLLDFYYSNCSSFLNCSKNFLNIYYCCSGSNNQEQQQQHYHHPPHQQQREDDEILKGIFDESLKYLNNVQKSFEANSVEFLKQILKLGDYILLKEWFNFVSHNSLSIITTLMYEDSKQKKEIKNHYLFIGCRNDFNKQMNFLDLAIRDIKNKDINKKEKLDPWFLFFCLVGFDNIQLMKHLVNQLKGKGGDDGDGNGENRSSNYLKKVPTTINQSDHFPLLISSSIKSTEMLDYIGKEFPQLLFNSEYSIWFHLKNLDLLKYYIESFNKITNLYPVLKLKNFEIPSSFSIIRYVIENPNIFKYDGIIAIIKPFDYRSYSNKELIATYQYMVEKTEIKFYPSLFCFHYSYDLLQPPIFILQFIDWLFDRYSLDAFKENGRFNLQDDCFLIKYLYLTGRFSGKNNNSNLYNNNNNNNNSDEQDETSIKNIELFPKNWRGNYTSLRLIYKFIANYSDTNAFDFIMNRFYKEVSQGKYSQALLNGIKDNISDILRSAVEYGQLKFLQHIQSNYSVLFKTNLKTSILTNNQLLKFVSISLSNDFIGITEFFLDSQLVDFNKNYFEKFTPTMNSSFNYFKNRFTN
ncbi:hypothetical protein ACTFIU_009333 [Dictyostelium citrinum]